MKNYNHGNNENNDRDHHNNYNDDDIDNNQDNDNGDQKIMIFQATHFGEPFVCEKAEFCKSAQILICLHSVNPCLIYSRKLRFLKNHSNGSSRLDQSKITGLTITKTNVKQIHVVFACKVFAINQIKGNIIDNMWRSHQHVVQKYLRTQFSINSKIL